MNPISILLQIGMIICLWKIFGEFSKGIKIKYGQAKAKKIHLLLSLLCLNYLFITGETTIGWIVIGSLITIHTSFFFLDKLVKKLRILSNIELYAQGQIILDKYEATGWGQSVKADTIRNSMKTLYECIPEDYKPKLKTRTQELRENWKRLKEAGDDVDEMIESLKNEETN